MFTQVTSQTPRAALNNLLTQSLSVDEQIANDAKAKFAKHYAVLLPEIRKLTKKWTGSEHLRHQAIELVTPLLMDDFKNRNVLVEFVTSKNAKVRSFVQQSLVQAGGLTNAIVFAHALMYHRHLGGKKELIIIDEVTRSLASLGKPAVDYLKASLLKTGNTLGGWRFRCRALGCLGKIGSVSEEAVPTIAALLWKRPRAVSEAAAQALGRIGGPQAAHELGKGLTSPPLLSIRSTKEFVAHNSSQAMVRLGVESLPILMNIIGKNSDGMFSKSYRAQRYAALAVGGLGVAATEAIPQLVKGMDSRNSSVAEACMSALLRVGPAAGSIVFEKLGSAKDQQANRLVDALVKFSREDIAVERMLMDRINSSSVIVQLRLLEIFRRLGTDGKMGIDTIRKLFHESPSLKVRLKSQQVFAEITSL